MPAKVARLETYTIDEIPNLKRRQLQTLCKANGIKANSKNIVLVKELQTKLEEMEEEKNILNQENESINSNKSSPQKQEATASPKSINNLIETATENIPKCMQISSNHNIKPPPPKPPQPEPEHNYNHNEITRQQTEDIDEIVELEEMEESENEEMINISGMTDNDYNANPNGNNGSFVEIDDSESENENDNNNKAHICELDRELLALRDETCYTNHNTTDISMNNINNGSMIGNDILNNLNDSNCFKDTVIMINNDVDESPLCFEQTPKLNESMEEFIRKSLNPPPESPILSIQIQQDKPENDDDDVDMEITPFTLRNNDEMNENNDEMNENNDEMNTSMLGMNASRISVNNDITDITDVLEGNECDTDEENWKQTPLKALQILDSIRHSISMENSNKKSKNFNDKEEEDIDSDNKCENQESVETDTSTVENLFYHSPAAQLKSPMKSPLNPHSHIVTPQSTVIEDVATNSRKISMRFGDGETYAFKSVCSTKSNSRSRSISCSAVRTNNKRRRSTSMLIERTSMTPEIRESLCEKTAVIRKIFDDVEQEQKAKIKAKKIVKAKAAPDWNKVHAKQIFSRQPDLGEWDKKRKERSERLFGNSSGVKMSTPTFRQRSKSFLGKKSAKIINSEARVNKKKVTIVPSSNDHLYNHDGDKKLNRKVFRQPTPYKMNVIPKAIKKPRFATSIVESSSESGSFGIAKKDLAFDPDKVKSKLFENTSSSINKMKKMRGSQTPQIIRSNYRNSKNSSVNKSRNKNKNWSAIKSKVDSNYNNNNNNNNSTKVSGVKRKLSWSIGNSNSNSNSDDNNGKQPAQKKRRISVQPQNVNSQNTKKWI